MELLEDLKILPLNFNFFMIYIIHKTLVLIKNNLNCHKDSIFECFFKEYNILLILYFFPWHTIMKSLSLVEENIIKDIKSLFRLKK